MNVRGTNRVFVLVMSVLLVVSLIMIQIPVKAEDTVVSLVEQDFLDAIQNPKTPTQKGITYTEDGEFYYFEMIPGEYKLAEDIDLGAAVLYIDNPGTYVFDLNGKTLSHTNLNQLAYLLKGNFTIKGNGTIENTVGGAAILFIDANAIIENGDFKGFVNFSSSEGEGSYVIENGNFERGLGINGKKTTAQINGGQFYDINSACRVWNEASVVINDGTFTSAVNGFESHYDRSRDPETMKPIVLYPAKSITINGGIFKSTGEDPECYGGLVLWGNEELKLTGGTFIAENNAVGGILSVLHTDNPVEEFNSYLGEGYKYQGDLELTTAQYEEGIAGITQKNISVVKNDSGSQVDGSSDQSKSGEKTTKVKAPKTDDEFLFWVGIVALAGAALIITSIVERQRRNTK